VVLDLLTQALEATDNTVNGLVDTALDLHGVEARGDGFETMGVDGLGEHGGGGGTVAGDVAGLGGDFFDHLGAHILVGIGQLDLFGDRDTVFGDRRRAPALGDDHIAATRSKRHFDGSTQLLYARENFLAGVFTKGNLFSHYVYVL
jgi:hypothetical protein